jgi:hypothetical protein
MNPDRLTLCPECGADLTGPKALLFMRGQGRRWGLIVWGVALLLMPIIGNAILLVVRTVAGPSPGGLGILSTQQLVEQRLPKQIDEPWVWNELERRLLAGSLTQQDVDNAIKKLTSHMTAAQPKGWDRPLSWQRNFLKSADQAGLISDPVLFDLCDAFYGPKPLIQPLSRVREGKAGFEIEIEYGSTWIGQSGLGVVLLWEIGQVLPDDEPIDVRQNLKHGRRWLGTYAGTLKAGDHEVTVEVECAYIDQGKLIGLNTNNLPKSLWPKARKRWKQSVSAPLRVYSTRLDLEVGKDAEGP